MNREILFRGKHVDNGDWVEGLLIRAIYDRDQLCIQSAEKQFGTYPLWEIMPETVGQHTGLVDKNGAKIFEGDIIEANLTDGTPVRHLIEYNTDECQYVAIFILNGHKTLTSCTLTKKWVDEFKKHVIGNTHDNPELIKSE